MNIHFIILPIIAISILILGILAYLRDRKSKTNRAFFFLSFSLAGWISIGGYYANLFPPFVPNLTFWVKVTMAFAALMGLFFTYFAFVFPKKSVVLEWYKKLWLGIGFIIAPITLFTNLVIKSAFVSNQNKIITEEGPLIVLYSGWSILGILIVVFILFKKYRRSKGITRYQFKYIFLGIFLFGAINFLTNLLIPAIFRTEMFINFGLYASFFLVAFFAYAIIKHRLMDIRLVIVKSMVFSCLLTMVASIYILVILYLKNPLQNILNINSSITYVLTGFIIAFGFAPTRKIIVKATDRWFYKGRYNPNILLDEVADITNSILLLEPLLQSLTYLLYKELRVGKIAILTSEGSEKSEENEKEKRSDRYDIKYQKSKIKYKNLVKLLNKKDILVYDEMKEGGKNKNRLRKLNISLVLSLKIENKPIGFIVLSNKKSGDAWTSEDIKFLTLISHQIAISIKNAQFYSKIVSDKQRIAQLLEERKELDKLKEEFQAIATHEINTPIAATEGYLSMVLEGKTGKISEKSKEFVEQAFQGTKRTHLLIKNLISAAEMEHGKININKLPSSIERIISEAVYELKPKAAQKNLKLIYNKSSDNIPKINIDPVLIKEAVLNLITNAIKFTRVGKITISVDQIAKEQNNQRTLRLRSGQAKTPNVQSRTLHKSKSYIVIIIEDTGVGMDKKHIPHIFDKFYQIDTSYTREYEGTGLGLYVVKSIIDLHKGTIKVQSKPNVGSKFEIWLPIAKEK